MHCSSLISVIAIYFSRSNILLLGGFPLLMHKSILATIKKKLMCSFAFDWHILANTICLNYHSLHIWKAFSLFQYVFHFIATKSPLCWPLLCSINFLLSAVSYTAFTDLYSTSGTISDLFRLLYYFKIFANLERS